MLFFWLATSIAWAECPLQQQFVQTSIEAKQSRKDISIDEFIQLLTQTKGCTTVIELWASWCGPCVKIAPEVEAFHQSHPDILFLSVSADASGSAAEKFWKQHPPIEQKYRLSAWSMTGLQDTYGSIGATFPEAIPYFVVLDASGTVQLEMHEPKSLSPLIKTIQSLQQTEKVK